MKRIPSLLLLSLVSAALYLPSANGSAQVEKTTQQVSSAWQEQIKGMQKKAGLFDVYLNADKARVLLAVPKLNESFILATSLPHGVGSNDVGLDRGQAGESRLVHFEKHGQRLMLVQENTRFIASSDNPQERASVQEAFARAVLWSGEILATENGRHLVDFSSFLTQDRHGIASTLAATRQGQYNVDERRSSVLVELAKSFPDNTELEAMLTFAGNGEGNFVRRVVADPKSITVQQHISLVRLPDAGYRARTYHPDSGGFNVNYFDFSTPLAESLQVSKQVRHRLEKTDPTAAVSTVKKPIKYYLDPGTPEPVRSALLEGARWWTSAFEKAGFKDAFTVELLPDGADPMDIRYNIIQWVHRSTRGWSYGNAISDPRTGEIIKGAVTLGSQRVRQDILIAESLLAPYGKNIDAQKKDTALQMALARLRQLAAHEVGHTLGLSHNYAASRLGNGSVMDYPHPLMSLNAQGEIQLSDAYGVGVGAWDDYTIAYIYGEYAPAQEEQALAALRSKARAQGLQFVSDEDSRPTGAVHTDGLLWDFGGDSLQTWDQLMAVRKRALDNFSLNVLPKQRQIGELQARLVPVYLLHRYQTEAVARYIAGGQFDYGLAADVDAGRAKLGVRVTPVEKQRLALQKLMSSLQAEQLALPKSVLDNLTPVSEGYSTTPEYFNSKMDSVFDPLAAAQAASAHTLQFILDKQRLNRLAWQAERDAKQLGISELFQTVFAHTWQAKENKDASHEAIQAAANWVVLDAALLSLEGTGLHPQVAAQVKQELARWATWLAKNAGQGKQSANRKAAADLITAYLRDPSSVKLRAMPSIPPGAPI